MSKKLDGLNLGPVIPRRKCKIGSNIFRTKNFCYFLEDCEIAARIVLDLMNGSGYNKPY